MLCYDLSRPCRHHARRARGGGYDVRCFTKRQRQPQLAVPLRRRPRKRRLEAGRAVIAAALGCKPDELYLPPAARRATTGPSALPPTRTAASESTSSPPPWSTAPCSSPCRQLEQEGYAVTYLAPDRQGNITAQQVADALREDTALVSVMLVNNETGCVFLSARSRGSCARALQGAAAHRRRAGVFEAPFRARDTLGAGLISVSGHKLNAPKGVGALLHRPALPRGASAARGRRTGARPALGHRSHGADRGLRQGGGAAAGGL